MSKKRAARPAPAGTHYKPDPLLSHDASDGMYPQPAPKPAPTQEPVSGAQPAAELDDGGPEHVGIHEYQQHRGPGGCKGWNTRRVSTQSTFETDRKVITRYRFCEDCQMSYKHVTVFAKQGDSWVVAGDGFACGQ